MHGESIMSYKFNDRNATTVPIAQFRRDTIQSYPPGTLENCHGELDRLAKASNALVSGSGLFANQTKRKAIIESDNLDLSASKSNNLRK
jgi:hypothetical protein